MRISRTGSNVVRAGTRLRQLDALYLPSICVRYPSIGSGKWLGRNNGSRLAWIVLNVVLQVVRRRLRLGNLSCGLSEWCRIDGNFAASNHGRFGRLISHASAGGPRNVLEQSRHVGDVRENRNTGLFQSHPISAVIALRKRDRAVQVAWRFDLQFDLNHSIGAGLGLEGLNLGLNSDGQCCHREHDDAA